MLLTAPLLARSSFFGALINKCRQVVKVRPSSPTENSTNHNKNNVNHFTPTANTTNNNPSAADTAFSSTAANPTPPTSKQQPHSTTALPNNNNNRNKNNNKHSRPAAVANISLSSTTAAPKPTLEEQVGLPPRPKKPLTPYFRYMRDLRPKVQAEHPDMKITEAVRLVSKRWETAEPSLKLRLQEEYKRDQMQYVERRAKYDSKITDEQRAEIKHLKQEIVEAKERKMMRQRVRDLGRPKKPASAFLRFIAKERTSTPQLPQQTYREWHQKCTAKWARLSEDEKAPYMQEARKELEKYKKEMSIWEEKMIRLGHIDVVRHGNLIDPPEPKPKKQSPTQPQL